MLRTENTAELSRDTVVSILNELAPGTVFSEEARENIRLFGSRVLRVVSEQAVQVSKAQDKGVVDTNDVVTALERLDLSSVYQSLGLKPTQKTSKRAQPVKLVNKEISSVPGEEKDDEEDEGAKPMPLFKKNSGHSRFVQEWLSGRPSQTFSATLGSALTLKRIMEAIKESCSQAEVNFDISEDGIDVQALGPSHVSLLSLKLQASGFESFSCTTETSLGIHISGLNSFLKQATKNDQISLFYTEGHRECCFILEDGQRSCTFEMKLKKMESNPLVITEVGYGSEWTLASASLLRICRDLKTSMTGENMHIVVSKDISDGLPKLSFRSSGVYGQLQLVCEKEMAKCTKFSDTEGILDLVFSYPYLNSFTKATPLSANVELKLGPNCPLMCGYEIENLGFLRYYLAPKLSDVGK